jgi:tetratricopeptide (TPR) repeat protein
MTIIDWVTGALRKPPRSVDDKREALAKQLKQIELLTFRFFLALLIAILIYAVAMHAQATNAAQFSGWLPILRVLSILLFLLFASAVAGGFLGFLFGIPRQLRQSNAPTSQLAVATGPGSSGNSTDYSQIGSGGADKALEARAAAATNRLYRNNTNLEEISDWITKIIVGISLVQATTIYEHVSAAADRFKSSAMADAVGADVVFVLVLVAGATAGFLFFYLETRTRITMLFVDTEAVVDPQAVFEQQRTIEAVARAPIADLGGRSDRPGRAVSAAPITEDQVLLNTPYDELQSPEQFAAWGSAQARAGNLQAAIRALNVAIAKQPNNKDLLLKLADVQALQGNWRTSYNLLAEAGESLKDDPEILMRELMASLYLGTPESFQKALPISEKLLASKEGAQDPYVYLWTAAAQGQRYGSLNPTDPRRREAREAALKAVKQLVALAPDPNSEVRTLLRQIFDPEHQGSPAEENDLEVFKDDPEFGALIYPSDQAGAKDVGNATGQAGGDRDRPE